MTAFQWEIPPAMVVSVPTDVTSRNDKYKFIASELRIK